MNSRKKSGKKGKETTSAEDSAGLPEDLSVEGGRDSVGMALEGLGIILGGVKGVSGAAIQYAAEKTFDQASKVISRTPEQLERMGVAGRSLRDLREVAGVTREELAAAIDLDNPDILKAIEEGHAALPFEILLRMASFYSRNDPIPFILKYARTYNPKISNLMEKIGLDKLVIEAEREIQIVQIYRSRDAARQLSDEAFERVRAFTERAFDMALHFAASGENIDLGDYKEEDDQKS